MKTIKELEKLDREIMEEGYVNSYRKPSFATKIAIGLASACMAGCVIMIIYAMVVVFMQVAL
jgi:hypothetical protein